MVLLIGSCSGETIVEVFDEYHVNITVASDSVHVKETLSIKNVIDKPIVPGYAYTTLKRSSQNEILGFPLPGKQTDPIDIKNVVVLVQGKQLNDVLVTKGDESTTIRYGLWFPISPGESMTVQLEYDSLDFTDKGILFTQGYYPIDANIPINKAVINLVLEDGRHVTYSNSKPETSNKVTTWTMKFLGTDEWNLKYEYSKLPLPTSPVKWSLLFWLFMLVIVSVWSYHNWKPRR
ncbi:MAG: hypothetical protein K0A89_00700 [ANME-2 cluster archaeon]|nr:hypothetical protein [ANME-2 cluster archaeon]